MMEQRLFSIAADKGHLEVVRFLVESSANKRPRPDRWWSNAFVHFWLIWVPSKTKAWQTMGQCPFTQRLRMGTLKLSDFWLSSVPIKRPEVVRSLGGPDHNRQVPSKEWWENNKLTFLLSLCCILMYFGCSFGQRMRLNGRRNERKETWMNGTELNWNAVNIFY